MSQPLSGGVPELSKSLTELLNELEYYTAALQRYDTTGDRSRGRHRDPDKRGKNYPYDRQVTYGQPAAYDRGSSGAGPSHQPLTPHTSYTSWEEVDEAMGTPTNFGMSNRSSLGGSVPGMGGGWSHAPIKPWDDEDDKKKNECDVAAAFGSTADDNVANVDQKAPSGQSLMIVAEPEEFKTGLGTAFKTSRELSDIGWKESRDIVDDSTGVWELLHKELLQSVRK